MFVFRRLKVVVSWISEHEDVMKRVPLNRKPHRLLGAAILAAFCATSPDSAPAGDKQVHLVLEDGMELNDEDVGSVIRLGERMGLTDIDHIRGGVLAHPGTLQGVIMFEKEREVSDTKTVQRTLTIYPLVDDLGEDTKVRGQAVRDGRWKTSKDELWESMKYRFRVAGLDVETSVSGMEEREAELVLRLLAEGGLGIPSDLEKRVRAFDLGLVCSVRSFLRDVVEVCRCEYKLNGTCIILRREGGSYMVVDVTMGIS